MMIRYWLNRLILILLYAAWPMLTTEVKREVNALRKDADDWITQCRRQKNGPQS